MSPLKKTTPIFLFVSPSTLSSASSRTMLMWMSNALSFPMNCFPFFSSMITPLFLESFNTSNGLDISVILYSHPTKMISVCFCW